MYENAMEKKISDMRVLFENTKVDLLNARDVFDSILKGSPIEYEGPHVNSVAGTVAIITNDDRIVDLLKQRCDGCILGDGELEPSIFKKGLKELRLEGYKMQYGNVRYVLSCSYVIK